MRDEGGVGLGQVVPDAPAAGEVPEQQVCLLAAEDPLRQDVQVVDRRRAPDEPELVVGGIAEYVDEQRGLQALQRLALAQQRHHDRSEEHTSELQSLMRLSYAVLCLKQKIITALPTTTTTSIKYS